MRAYAWADVWYVQMRTGKVMFILIRGFCVVFHTFVFRRKEHEGERQHNEHARI